MAHIDLVCQDCQHSFAVLTRGAMKPQQKRCPECGSDHIRQTFASYLRNGPLSDPNCGAPGCTTYG
jgi:putative FmdB family regulatory protein